jgi:hypothetical protein
VPAIVGTFLDSIFFLLIALIRPVDLESHSTSIPRLAIMFSTSAVSI